MPKPPSIPQVTCWHRYLEENCFARLPLVFDHESGCSEAGGTERRGNRFQFRVPVGSIDQIVFACKYLIREVRSRAGLTSFTCVSEQF